MFGSSTSTSSSLFKPFGSTATTAAAPSLFGSSATTTAPSLFGSTSTSTAPSLFGSTSTATSAPSLFGSTTSSAPSLFGSNPASTTTTSLFGKPTLGTSTLGGTTGSLFGNTASTQLGAGQPSNEIKTLQSVILNSQAFTAAISNPKLYGDDRDATIALFNQLLASVGTAKGYYEKDKNPVEFDSFNPFYQFKAVGYCALSHHKNTDGILGLIINEPISNFSTQQQKQKLLDTLYSIMGSDPSLHAHFVDVRPTSDTACEVDIYVTKRESGRINAQQVYQYFDQKDKFTALQQQLKVLKIVPKVEMDESGIQKYLSHPPNGFTEVEWREAIILNPEPKNLLPYPVYGFKELSDRRHRQIIESEEQRKVFNALSARKKAVVQELQEVDGLRKIFAQDAARLKHRILRIIISMYTQSTKNALMSIEEEKLANRIDTVSACITAPNRILDNLENIRNYFKSNKTQFQENTREYNNSHGLNEEEAGGLKRYLNRRQQDLENLVKTLKVNADDVDVMNQHLRGL